MVHWFWFSIFLLSILWYILVTVIVGIKGFSDIRKMVRKFKGNTNIDGHTHLP